MAHKKVKANISYIEPQIFVLEDTQQWLNHLHDEGFVVIGDAISVQDANESLEMFKNEFTYVSPNFDWNNTETWTTNNLPMVINKSSVVYNGFGQSDSNWNLRLKSRAKEAFSHVFETDELITSFDGFSLFLSDKQKSLSWLHQDQRPEDTRLSVQGILNIMDCGIFDAGFICVPRSHVNYVPEPSNTDWMNIPKDHPFHKSAVKILAPARSLILFNSKLVHANIGMAKNHPKELHINRFSAYLTFVPKERRNQENYIKRVHGYLQGTSCSHFADIFVHKIPTFHIRKKITSFNNILPSLTEYGEIPPERLELI